MVDGEAAGCVGGDTNRGAVRPLQETVTSTTAQIIYEGPLVNYLTYDGPR
jgi:hypothetical protein